MEKRENQRIKVTKRMLYEALVRLLEKKSINEISVTELCREAGINRATFYKHYSTPNDILVEIIRAHLTRLVDIQKSSDIKSDLLQILEASCQYIYDNASFFRLVMTNDLDSSLYVRFFSSLTNCPELSVAISPSFDEVDRSLISTFVACGGYHLIRHWLVNRIPKSPSEIAALIYSLITSSWLEGV